MSVDFQNRNYDTLVLAGGGVKGFYCLGAIQCAMDNGLLNYVYKYVGTSIGSIIGYLLAIGYTPVEIVVTLFMGKYMDKIQGFNIVSFVNKEGALNFGVIQEAIEKLTLEKVGRFLTLGKLKSEFGKELYCTTYNMTKNMTEYIGPDNYPDVPCLIALRMSCNIPLIFSNFKYMDNYYIDGGITENFPIEKGVEIGENVIGINLEINEKVLKYLPEENIASYFIKLLQIPIVHSMNYKIDSVRGKAFIVRIKTGNINNLMEFKTSPKESLEMFSTGYSTMKDYNTSLNVTYIDKESIPTFSTESKDEPVRVENKEVAENKESKEEGKEGKESKENKENIETIPLLFPQDEEIIETCRFCHKICNCLNYSVCEQCNDNIFYCKDCKDKLREEIAIRGSCICYSR